MADRIELTFWNYVHFEDYSPNMLEDWVKCGMTLPWTPQFSAVRDDNDAFIAILDHAERLGVKMILQVEEMFLPRWKKGDNKYREDCIKYHEKFGHHPAVYGYYVGEEPDAGSNESYFEGVKILREVTGLPIFCNMGSVERTERMLLTDGETLQDWMKSYASYTGADILGYGSYAQLIPGGLGIDEHYYNLRQFMTGAQKSGMDIWASMLSSAHYSYRIPTEYDFQWQISTCVACGCRAIVWFRLYDKCIAPEYWGSPIDEFGEKTQRYYDLARVQKRFNMNYGEIMAKLHHQETYGVGYAPGGYHYFLNGTSELVTRAVCPNGIISFFKDDEGGDYAVVVNNDQEKSAVFALTFGDKVNEAGILRQNGKTYSVIAKREGQTGEISAGEFWMAPGQMELIKIK